MNGYCPQWQDLLSDWDLKQASGTSSTFDYTATYDGIMYVYLIDNSANNHGIHIYINGNTLDYGGNFHGGQGSINITLPYTKGDIISMSAFRDNYGISSFYVTVREYKKRDYSGR